MKHAYLIIAHNEFEVLKRLLQAIDDERNDIYIHFDRKVKRIPEIHTLRSKLHILENRIDVRWGDISLIEAEYILVEEASQTFNYNYYHLLSGVDMPLKTQNYIHQFFENNLGKEFIGYYQGDIKEQITLKVQRFHLFPKDFKSRGVFARIKGLVRDKGLSLQKTLGLKRNKHIAFKKGTNWISVTHAFVSYLLSHKEENMRIYHHTCCSDEIFVHTICWNSSFRDKLFDMSNEEHGCLRMINWQNNQLVDWKEKDYEKLMKSDALFARKFTNKHIKVVDEILKNIK